MKRPTFSFFLLSGLLLYAVGTAEALVTTQMLGDQDFADGATPASPFVPTFNSASAGEPFPFNGFIGSDAGTNFSASWTFNYGALVGITNATLTLGIFDHDSAAPGSQVNSFTLNGAVSLTSDLDALFEASQGANNQVRVYTLTLPGSAFSQLATGTSTFALALKGPGLGILSPNNNPQFNGAGLDFSTLSITAQDQAPPPGPSVPEPPTAILLLIGASVLLAFRLRCKTRSAVHDTGKMAN